MRPVPFGKYILRQRVAVGGMAEVYKATHASGMGFERPVAIKCILPELAANREFVRMLIDEAKIASLLSHPNIASIYDLGHENGRYFIVMEYVHGRDVRQIEERQAARGGLVPLAVTCHLVMKTCEALHHAHTADRGGKPLELIHRDVSPQNLLVSFDGEVKVIDFGLAKAVGRAVQTQSGIVKGKLAYMSPEQARGKPIDHRSDVYSLGICLWELLSGRRLFYRGTEVDTILAVQRGVIPPLRSIDPSVPEELDSIVKRALDADPVARYQRALDMHDDLETFVYATSRHLGANEMATYIRELFPEGVVDIGFGSAEVEMPEARRSASQVALEAEVALEEEERNERSATRSSPPVVEPVAGFGTSGPPRLERDKGYTPDKLPWEDLSSRLAAMDPTPTTADSPEPVTAPPQDWEEDGSGAERDAKVAAATPSARPTLAEDDFDDVTEGNADRKTIADLEEEAAVPARRAGRDTVPALEVVTVEVNLAEIEGEATKVPE